MSIQSNLKCFGNVYSSRLWNRNAQAGGFASN